MNSGSQCRAARALVESSRTMLASRSGVELSKIERFEHIAGSLTRSEGKAVQYALEDLGAVFISENGTGYGVRLKFRDIEAAQIARLECEGGIVANDRVP